ncbi:MAG: hypothetical protein V4717_23060 [Bacteroidota bacterium]
MNKPDIKSYDELVSEKERLKALFTSQKEGIKTEIAALKDNFNPVKTMAKKFGKFTTPDKSLGLLNAGLSFAVDLILRKVILKKSGWMVRLAAPFIVKNVVSHFAANKIKSDMPGIQDLINSFTKKDI